MVKIQSMACFVIVGYINYEIMSECIENMKLHKLGSVKGTAQIYSQIILPNHV